MTKHEEAFNDFLTLCVNLLKEEAKEKTLDLEQAKSLVRKDDNLLTYEERNSELYHLGSAWFHYQNALEVKDFSEKLTYLVLGFSDYGELSDGNAFESFKSEIARKNASKSNRIKKDEKAIVKECWEAWQKKPSQYKGKTAFANDMVKKFEQDDPEEQKKHLSSVANITDWCRDWEKEKSQSAS